MCCHMPAQGPAQTCQLYGGNLSSTTCLHILSIVYMNTLEYHHLKTSDVYLQTDSGVKYKLKFITAQVRGISVRYINYWYAQSLNLNHIKHVWHQLKLNLTPHGVGERGVRKLLELVDVERNKLNANVCKRHINSMPAKVETLIKTNGRYRKY